MYLFHIFLKDQLDRNVHIQIPFVQEYILKSNLAQLLEGIPFLISVTLRGM